MFTIDNNIDFLFEMFLYKITEKFKQITYIFINYYHLYRCI